MSDDPRVQAAIAHWAPRFIAQGIDYNDFVRTTDRILRWEDWCSEWQRTAADHERLARGAEERDSPLAAADAWIQAAMCHHFGKFVFFDEGLNEKARRGEAHDSMVCQGCIISGGHVRRSILSPNVRVNSFSLAEDSILFDGVDVGRFCHIRKAIIDKEVKIPPNSTIGYDLAQDRQRGFVVTEQGVVVIAKAELPESFASRILQTASATAGAT